MGRVQIDLPDKKVFDCDIAVRVSDLNYGNHLGHDSVLTLMQEARVAFYRTIGLKDELSLDESVGQIIADAAIQYKAEAFLGDELNVRILLGEFSKYGFEMFYLIINKNTGKEIARGKTGIVCFDYSRKKIATVPPAFIEKINNIKIV